MNELTNTAKVTGTYDNVPTSLTSNTFVVSMIEGLTLTMDADQKNWVNGDLKYTITLSNSTDKDYTNLTLTDVIDNNYVDFIKESLTLNDQPLDQSKYTYEEGIHTLTVNLDDLSATTTATLTFRVKKKT